MRVLFLQSQPCVRALKYAVGLRHALGDEIQIIFGYLNRTLTEFYGHGDEFFDKFVKLDPGNLVKGIRSLVKKYKVELIHSHNAPDFLTVSAIRAVEDVPIIHDCHEALTIRKTRYAVYDDEEEVSRYRDYEKTANEQSDGRIYVTEGVKDYIQRMYRVDPERDLVFNSYVSESMFPKIFEEKLSERDGQTHIVYIGTVTSRIEGSHYDLREIFREIADHGMHIHIYVNYTDEAYPRLAETSKFIHYHGHLDRRLLFQEMTRYDFGWAGFNTAKNKEHLDVMLPNKVMEYIACGLPVLSYPHKTLKEFIERHRVGLVFNDIQELTELLETEETDEMRAHILEKRYELTLEKNIWKVVDFYNKILT